MAKSLRMITFAFVGCLTLGNMATIGILAVTGSDNRARISVVSDDNRTLETKIAPLGGLIKDIEIDVVQVQQFLQDYSATRAEDGLDHGLEEAETYVTKFTADVAAARDIARALGRRDLDTTLGETAEAFGPYREVGFRMARAYAAAGTHAGNAMMPDFDERAEALRDKVASLLAIRDGLLRESATRISSELAALQAASDRAGYLTSAAMVTLTLLSLGCAILLLMRVVRPITVLAEVMHGLARDRTGVRVPFVERGDEIGSIARATDVFREAIESRERMRRETAEAEERVRAERRRDRLALADDFAERVSAVVDGLGVTAERIGRDARGVDTIARSTATLTDETARAMSRTDGNVAAVSSAADTLTLAIGEVERRMHQAESISTAAAEQAGRTNQIVRDLSDSTQRIGEIVGLINAVAAQTNLLALNATIEAARAGDAGRGFAVVAQEVKQLAAQTSKATEDIARQIDAVQSVTGTAVTAINSITETVKEVGDILHTITEAVEEQSTATREIARSIAATTRETGAVSANVQAVDGSTRETTVAAVSMVAASEDLTSVARRLREEANAFVARMRA